MKYGCKHIAALLFFLLACSFVYGQVSVRASVDKDRILIGEPILLSVEAAVPSGQPFTWFNADTIPHFEFIEKFRTDTAEHIDGKKISQLLSITSFDSGRWQIPSFKVVVAGETYLTDSISVDVAFASFNPADDYRDIKDIVDVVNPSSKYIPWIVAAVTFIALGLLIYLLRKKRPAVTAKKEISRWSPYEEAMQALDELKKKGGVAEDGDKGYYSRLNDILRVFVLRKHGLSTLERTNDELIVQLSKMQMPRESYSELTQALKLIDFVKFAKYQPAEEDKTRNVETIRSSIEILDKKVIVSAV